MEIIAIFAAFGTAQRYFDGIFCVQTGPAPLNAKIFLDVEDIVLRFQCYKAYCDAYDSAIAAVTT